MKVVKKGKLPDTTLRGTCRNCGCIVEVKPHETICIPGDRPFDADGKYVQCPTLGCPELIYF